MAQKRYESMFESHLESGETLESWIDAGKAPNLDFRFDGSASRLARRFDLSMERAIGVAGGCLVGLTDRRLIGVEPARTPKLIVASPRDGARVIWWDTKNLFGVVNRQYIFLVEDVRWFHVETMFRAKQASRYDDFIAEFGPAAENPPAE